MGPAFLPRYMAINPPRVKERNYAQNKLSKRDAEQQLDDLYLTRKKKLPFSVSEDYRKVFYEEPVLWPDDPNSPLIKSKDDQNIEFSLDDYMDDSIDTEGETIESNENPWEKTEPHNDEIHQVLNEADLAEPPMPADSYAKSYEAKNEFLAPADDEPVEETRKRRSYNDVFSWTCRSEETWIDLGAMYFPRFVRNVICTQGKCLFNHHCCRPKKIPRHILRKLKDSCIAPSADDVSNFANMLSRDANLVVPIELRQRWVFEMIELTTCCKCDSLKSDKCPS
ncbi:hypothetical protein CHUAL_006902 [Chamberlinius hualienensis]